MKYDFIASQLRHVYVAIFMPPFRKTFLNPESVMQEHGKV